MAAPRATQFIALRNLARGGQQTRKLHMLGPASYSSPITHKEQRSALTPPRDTAGLHTESKRRRLDVSGTGSEMRTFTTTSAMQARHDASTIDFFYFPELDNSAPIDADMQVRVPIIPTLNSAFSPQPPLETYDEPVMRAEVSSMSADAIFHPMADLSDGHAMNIDFHSVADQMASISRSVTKPVEEQASTLKQIWNDMLDDLVSGLERKGRVAAA